VINPAFRRHARAELVPPPSSPQWGVIPSTEHGQRRRSIVVLNRGDDEPTRITDPGSFVERSLIAINRGSWEAQGEDAVICPQCGLSGK